MIHYNHFFSKYTLFSFSSFFFLPLALSSVYVNVPTLPTLVTLHLHSVCKPNISAWEDIYR